MIRGQACRLLAEIVAGFLIRILKDFSDGRGFPEKPGFSLELSLDGLQVRKFGRMHGGRRKAKSRELIRMVFF